MGKTATLRHAAGARLHRLARGHTLSTLLTLAGAVLLAAGLREVYRPLGLIAAGALLLLAGLFRDYDEAGSS